MLKLITDITKKTNNMFIKYLLSRYFLSLLLILFLNGCTAPDNKLRYQLENSHLTVNKIKTEFFEHNYVLNKQSSSKRLHIYIHGDGTPWIKGRWKAVDPSPSNFLTLQLMLQDTQNSLYLARPCYHGTVDQTACESKFWTSARYSKKVIDSMLRAIKLLSYQYDEVILFGYSGGAVIATLVAEELEKATALVTIAGNLDIDQWAFTRRIKPLKESINPMAKPFENLPATTIHIVGENDTSVPMETTFGFAQKFESAIWIYKEFGHICCWDMEWPKIINRINMKLKP